jgi:hypothetical protein
MRRVTTSRVMSTVVALALIGALGAACSSSKKEHAAPASCDLSRATITNVVPGPGSDSEVIAKVSRVGAMNESGVVITVVTVSEDGRVDALADGPGRGHRHGTLDAASLESLRRCIDETKFVDIAEGYQGPTQGTFGSKFCTITDAPEVTVVATGSSGETRTATGYALGNRGEGCDYGDPPALTEVYAALEQVRQVVSDTATG